MISWRDASGWGRTDEGPHTTAAPGGGPSFGEGPRALRAGGHLRRLRGPAGHLDVPSRSRGDSRGGAGAGIGCPRPRFGHVCAELGATAELVPEDGELTDRPLEVDWPAVGSWIEELADSPLVWVAVKDGLPEQSGIGSRIRPLVLDGGRLYLQRYWHYEVAVADDLEARVARPGEPSGDRAVPDASLGGVLDDLFGPDDPPRARPATPGPRRGR